MPDSIPNTFRLTVLVAMTEALKEITPANGYHHDLAYKVFRGRTTFDTNDPIPMVAINEKPVFPEELPTPGGSSDKKTELELLVQGFIDDDRKNPTDPAYKLLGSVQKRLAQEKRRDDGCDIFGFNGRVTDMFIGQGVVRPPDAVVSDKAYFWLPVTLTFGENLNEPFA